MNLPLGVILIVDDDPHVLKALGRLDLGSQFRLRLCDNVADAQKILDQEEVEVALVDQHLAPDGPTGLDLLAILRERDADCFRIIFTGAADLAFAVSAINQGLIDAFLVKPWTNEQLHSLLNQGCETALLRRHNRQLASELANRNAALEHLNEQLEQMVEERTASLHRSHAHLKKQQQELVRLETQSTVTQIARGLAHELNNPLAAILGYSQRLARRLGSDLDAVKRLDVILTEVERCRGLVDQLRNLAAPLDEAIIPCHPADILHEACARLRDSGHEPPICHSDEQLPSILGAPRSLARVFEQIIANATLSGASHCTLSAEPHDERVRLIFTNNGNTPSQSTCDQALRPFFTTHHDTGHRGLGLTIASSLLREQDGLLTLMPRRDGENGAECHVILPLSNPVAVETSTLRAPENSSEKVLIVDDDPMITELLSEFLKEGGIDVEVVNNCQEANAALEKFTIRAVIADYHLDRDSGIHVLKQLIARQPPLSGHVAIFTGASDAQTIEHLQKEANCPILAKPFRLEQVHALVRAIW
jgi:ActR/RegA family two-component response regulator